jgi:cytochrome d ubiquinol oxidase subunit I
LLKGRNVAFAKRSIMVASAFGLAASLCVIVLGDESGYIADHNQRMKVAAMEGMWETEPAPASLTIFGIPNQQTRQTTHVVRIPYLLGLLATRSLHTPIYGIFDLVDEARDRVRSGMLAYSALTALQLDPNDKRAETVLETNQENIGYGLLLKRYTDDVIHATPELINQAAWDTVPDVPVLFWTFRIMVGCGFFFLFIFGTAFYLSQRRRILQHRWFLWAALLSLPLPWVAAESGWIVAEYGRQPWVVEGLLPTFLGVSSVSAATVWISLIGFIFFYTILAVVELYLMIKYIKLGPDNLFAAEDFSVYPQKNDDAATKLNR